MAMLLQGRCAHLFAQSEATAKGLWMRLQSKTDWKGGALPSSGRGCRTPSGDRRQRHQFVKLDYNLTLNNRGRDSVFFELFDDKPLTVANFLKYVTNTGVEHGSYDGSIMHRLSRNFVLQGGGYHSKPINTPTAPYVALDPTGIIDFDGNANTSNLTVAGEYSVGATRSNLTGTVSMAYAGPNTGTNQWFVNLADNTFLDNSSSGGPFTVFARVAGDGMNLFSVYNKPDTISIANLNPDTNGDGVRDGGRFSTTNPDTIRENRPTDGVPYFADLRATFCSCSRRYAKWTTSVAASSRTCRLPG